MATEIKVMGLGELRQAQVGKLPKVPVIPHNDQKCVVCAGRAKAFKAAEVRRLNKEKRSE